LFGLKWNHNGSARAGEEARVGDEARVEGLEAGADNIVGKPVREALPDLSGQSGADICCLCGMAHSEPASLNGAEWDLTRTIACILRCWADDELAFRELLKKLKTTDRHPLKPTLTEFLSRIDRTSAQHRVVAGRFDRILALYDRQFGCRSTTHGRTDACDC
jgi:hypothetical protein